jgi:PAS domain S-box-containing protein
MQESMPAAQTSCSSQTRLDDQAGATPQSAPEPTITAQSLASDSLLSALADVSHVGMNIIQDGRFQYVNNRVSQMLGYSPEEFQRQDDWLFFVHPEDRSKVLEQVQRRTDGTAATSQYVFRGVRKDGSTVYIDVHGSRTTYRGRPAAVATLLDVTERVKSEQELRASAERYRELFEANPLPMWVCDRESTRFLAVNEAAVAHYGYSREEFQEMSITDLHPRQEGAPPNGTAAHLTPEPDYPQLWKHRKKNGALIDVEITVRDFNFEGKPRRLVLAVDVTERTRLEQQMRQSQKMEAVGLLAGGVAHDFNNLLTVINGYSDLLLSGSIPAETAPNLIEEIRKAGERAASLTRQLLVMSRNEMVQPVALDLNSVVSSMEKMLQRVIGEDIALAAVLQPGLGLVRADQGQIEQVILNLAVNSRDAMPRGGHLTIETATVMLDAAYARTHPSVQPGTYCMLAVSDTGCGVSDEVKARMFEPFFTTKEPGRGTGLGLATVYGIVKQSGGGIGVYSEPGLGTTFKIYLPLISSTSQVGVDAASPVVLPRGAETLLVAEDDPMVRGLLRCVLKGAGYNLLEAESGTEALRLAQEAEVPIDLLITDVVMPQMSGRELAERLHQKGGPLRVLYLSGYTNDAVVRHGVLQAEVSFLQKPFTPAALTRKVREVLDR